MTDLYTRMASDEFKNKLPFPDRVRRPEILSRPAGQLTPEEIAGLPAAMQAYNDAVEAQKAAHCEYDAETSRLTEAFAAALFEEYDIPVGHPFGQKMYSIAWDRGHAHGFNDVASCFGDLAGLWDEALKMASQAKGEG